MNTDIRYIGPPADPHFHCRVNKCGMRWYESGVLASRNYWEPKLKHCQRRARLVVALVCACSLAALVAEFFLLRVPR